MKRLIFSLLFLFYSGIAEATDITSEQTTAVTVSGNSETINVTGSGNLLVDSVAIVNGANTGVQ